MVYLDYSATTPIHPDVLDSYNRVCNEYFGNAHSQHKLGVKSLDLINSATKQIAELFNIKETEITYTSGATEANNIALINTCLANEKLGKHIIVSKLEHPSVYKICNYLETLGYKIDYVNNQKDGLIDLEDLKKLIKKDTVLVSVCGVNSEVGIRQPLKLIHQIMHKENPNTLLHSDVTQCIGKVNVNLNDVDLASFSAHKFYGPHGIGIFYKNSKVKTNPLIIGSGNELVGGTPPTPLIVSMAKALRISLQDLNKKEMIVKKHNDKICNVLLKYEKIVFNKTKNSIPHILNISVPGIKPETFIHVLEEYDVYIGSNTAYSNEKMSTAVYALTNDKKLAASTLRICLSYQTTNDEVNTFLYYFDQVYTKLQESENK